MKDYHNIWLKAHPDRTADWLQSKLSEGFDVHHLDGDKTNGDPGNLVLIEHLDHMRIHVAGGNRLKIRPLAELNRKRAATKKTDKLVTAQEALEAQVQRHFFTTTTQQKEREKENSRDWFA